MKLTPVLFSCILLSAILPAASPAVDPPNDIDKVDTTTDATKIDSRISLSNEFANKGADSWSDKLKIEGNYAWKLRSDRDSVLDVDLPVKTFNPGDAGGPTVSGLGDLTIGVGHVIDGTGMWRHGIYLEVTLDSATETPLGDGRLRLAPQYISSLRL
ncbi:MAG: hypothetical protein WCR20_24100, partial [Verrucomicrobiota bacterium]